jgi:hypothetical protein
LLGSAAPSAIDDGCAVDVGTGDALGVGEDRDLDVEGLAVQLPKFGFGIVTVTVCVPSSPTFVVPARVAELCHGCVKPADVIVIVMV